MLISLLSKGPFEYRDMICTPDTSLGGHDHLDFCTSVAPISASKQTKDLSNRLLSCMTDRRKRLTDFLTSLSVRVSTVALLLYMRSTRFMEVGGGA